MSRLFFALWPDEAVRKQLGEVANEIKEESLRYTKISNLHITLAFLGDVSASDQAVLMQLANKIQSSKFCLELNRIGWWRKPGILWIAPNTVPEVLKKLVEQLQTMIKQQGLSIDERPYKPHVTIARKVKVFTAPEIMVHIPWAVTGFALIVSKSTENGVDYQVVQEWLF